MIALWFALLTGGPLPASAPSSPVLGRIYTSPTVHVGLRPSIYFGAGEVAAAVTVQVSMIRFL